MDPFFTDGEDTDFPMEKKPSGGEPGKHSPDGVHFTSRHRLMADEKGFFRGMRFIPDKSACVQICEKDINYICVNM